MDFAARMQWTLGSEGNHHPKVVVNGSLSSAPLTVSQSHCVRTKQRSYLMHLCQAILTATTWTLFKWTQYHESPATRWTTQAEAPSVEIMPIARGLVNITVPSWENHLEKSVFMVDSMEFHIILEITKEPMKTFMITSK
ncbi:hypothetical protein V1517DRAFT_174681 [Lipomyces orientalis]|uniref:Uncharacterized protein n=1 Tax=Lipomyces orientalis TaxID=1233043 RepID=A0ACC3TJP9_9ASCO